MIKANRSRLIAAVICAALLFSFSFAEGSAYADSYVTTSVIELNSPPVCENIELTTYRSCSVTGTFRCTDPEGDEVSYSVTGSCRKGDVTVDGNSFIYTPADGKKGKDSFSYVAIDSFGNISNEATVTISIKKQSTSVTYSDMIGSGGEYAAVHLAESGVFVGEKVGEEYLFHPSDTVSRGEFLAMCIELSGIEKVTGMKSTGFYDDDDIPVWQKPYVSAALLNDMVSGCVSSDGHIVFSADAPITFAQAAVILNNAVKVTDVSVPVQDDICPVWAAQATANLVSCNILADTAEVSGVKPVTRADAARMLLAAAGVIDSREKSFSLLNWGD